MAKFGSKEEILEKISGHFTSLNAGKLSLDELNELVELSATLYERSVILRYKAIEAKVFEGSGNQENETVNASISSAEKPVETERAEQSAEEIISFEEQEDESETTSPTIDFSMFARTEEQEPEEESTSSELSESEFVPENPEAMEKPELETPTATQHATTGVFATYGSKSQSTQSADNSLGGKLKLSKLDSLVGSFGMNERLQYINELFDGSGEAFSDAIKTLDNMNSLDEARKKAISFGEKYAWDVDSETVGDFMQKLDRRYA